MSASATEWPSLAECRAALAEADGGGVRVAVLDSGIEWSHPELQSLERADDFEVCFEGDFAELAPGGGVDLYGHGTAIAHIVHANAPGAGIGSFRVLNEGLRSQVPTVAEGVRFAIEHGYRIVHCSFSCGEERGRVRDFKEWIDAAYVQGVHVVAASHHQNRFRRGWPGHFPTVLTVGIGPGGEEAEIRYRPDSLVEFWAPGHELKVAWKGGGFRRMTGSSYAAPHVTALLARLLAAFPNLTPSAAKALLQALAEPWVEQGTAPGARAAGLRQLREIAVPG